MFTEDLLSTQQVLATLGISRTQLYRLMNRGRIEPIAPAIEAKRQVRLKFRRADVERLAQPIARAG